MPQKKRGVGDAVATDGGDAADPVAPKRQRVSLACDACRAAREKCDGVSPRCGTCISQSRSCSYTPASKKRGVQTGYLRTVELSLAWLLFEQAPENEEALHQLLTCDGSILHKKSKAADRLHRKWTKSRISKSISCLLSGASPHSQSRTDTSEADSDIERDEQGPPISDFNETAGYENSPIALRPRGYAARLPPANLKLPGAWRKLLDIYFSYTHCYFPITDRTQVFEAAMEYPSEGISSHSYQVEVPPRHAELWAVLSLAAFQDSSSASPSSGDLSAKAIYSIARSLIPSEETKLETPHLRSLLLHSLVLIGQGAELSAWMLVGTATRLALHLRVTGGLFVDGPRQGESASRSGILALASCFILDTLTSACLGQPTSLRDDLEDVHRIVASLGESAEGEAWTPAPGFGPAFEQRPVSQTAFVQPFKTFRQLLRFSRVLSANLNAPNESNLFDSATAPGDLVQSLDSEYSFCNSLVFGGSTPSLPSAFLLQTVFLATTTRLIPVYRASLLSSLMEVVDSCVSAFGACGTPPIIVGLLGIVQRCGYTSKMHEAEQSKWRSVVNSLRQVWKLEDVAQSVPSYGTAHPILTDQQTGAALPAYGHGAVYDAGNVQRELLGSRPYIQPVAPPERPHHQTTVHSGPRCILPEAHGESSESHGIPIGPPGRNPISTRTVPLDNSGTSFQQSGVNGPVASVLFHAGNNVAHNPVDYDAILEELGSIDGPEGLDMDPQFMANLGFVPGCDLAEIFQGDFGV
ncbi:Quinic acid utilization activator-like protein [Hapsidospora chrysogenum ATCC 11550]|uniref:Quinic acid utilization activator-like protein n=1 Tax=Hapsidospora chrysogenum (strain ATCC 11550 / CBS 779.69 / DSM 880 / IAM 14645 / JCM 23072 / IMI 49137) TaxID=857340 RepID=A0A086TH86_HAPC1|nr:Quinic acid utilization activator-like protein [Hapsidospora chrysogenum ATCC 11550]